jgi:acyl carrier protein
MAVIIDEGLVRTQILDYIEAQLKQRGGTLDRANIANDWHLLDRGLLTSVQALELLFQLEESLEIEIDYLGRDPALFLTFGGLIEVVLSSAEESGS